MACARRARGSAGRRVRMIEDAWCRALVTLRARVVRDGRECDRPRQPDRFIRRAIVVQVANDALPTTGFRRTRTHGAVCPIGHGTSFV